MREYPDMGYGGFYRMRPPVTKYILPLQIILASSVQKSGLIILKEYSKIKKSVLQLLRTSSTVYGNTYNSYEYLVLWYKTCFGALGK